MPETMNKLFHKQTAPAQMLITGAEVLDPRTGISGAHDLLIKDGVITELGAPGALPREGQTTVIDAAGKHLFPAFTDPHVHLRTPGQEYKENIASGTAAAAAGGFCQLIAMPNTTPTVDSTSVLNSLIKLSEEQAHVPTGFTASITLGLKGETLSPMAALADAGALGFTDDGKPVTSAGMLRKALQYQKLAGGVIALHEEDPTLSGAGAMHEGSVSARLGITGIPSISESLMVGRDSAIALYEDAQIHCQHISARESVEILHYFQERGTKVSGEATPHHLILTHEDVAGLDTTRKMNPPVRSDDDRQAVIEGLRSGVLGCIATDHAPHARHEKEMPFEQAPMGTTGIETSFASVYTELVKPGILPLELVIERMTAGCAIFGLPIPRIEHGAQANLVLVDLERTWKVGEHGYVSRASNSCFHGYTFSAVVELTVAAGQVAFQQESR
jgi:dihydroorotase